jgi:hypothetical protein
VQWVDVGIDPYRNIEFLHRIQAIKHRITPKAESYTYRLAVFKKVGLFEHCSID